MCVGLGLGPLGAFAALLHLVNHAVAKAMMFFLSGRILDRYRTTEMGEVSGLLRAMPMTGGLFAAGLLALIGLPPFGIFFSKFALVRAGFATGHPWLMGAVLALLLVAVVAMLVQGNRMLYGAPPEGIRLGEGSRWGLVPLALCAVLLVAFGSGGFGMLQSLLARAVEVVSR
jgi:hydrogenase-4 component F